MAGGIAMRQLFRAGTAMGALLLWVTSPAAAQTSQASVKTYQAPRTPDGHPDLQGVYDLATITPVERPAGAGPTYTKEQAAKIEAGAASLRRAGDKAVDGNRTAPPKGGDGSPGPAGNVGGYNLGWLDPGSTLTIVDGQIRSSIVIDPPDGRVPPMTPAAKARMTAVASEEEENTDDPGLEKAPGAYDNPERRPLGERCLLGFGSTSGPPALPDYFYNNLHQIVQTPKSIMILTEMVHDARIIRMNAQHLPKNIRLWMGDSVGHWEGATLVVDTTNFTDKTRFRGSTENLHVVERFSRIDGRTLLYRFTIEDPETWSRPWTGEYAWPATDGKIYEYACHEGNYSLTDILKGARERDKQGTEAKPLTRN
jgi:hypothetical protein